jgi:hypothetical protein
MRLTPPLVVFLSFFPGLPPAPDDLRAAGVQVISREAAKTGRLTVDKFELTIDGKRQPLVSAVFLHNDGGEILPPREWAILKIDSAIREVCAFGFKRGSGDTHAHYELRFQPVGLGQYSWRTFDVKVKGSGLKIGAQGFSSSPSARNAGRTATP